MADENYVYGENENGWKYAYAEKITVDRNNERDSNAQRKAGGELREYGDDGMHLLARVANGAKGSENLVAGCRSINRGSYKSMENSIIKAAENHPDDKVSMRVDTFYGKDRPDVFQVENTLTDKDGNVTDRQTVSYTNLDNQTKEGQDIESGTEFSGYIETLSDEERALANEAQEKIDSGEIRINEGLDQGWKYIQFDPVEEMDMSTKHDDFVKGLRVEVSPPETPPAGKPGSTSTGGRERGDGPGMGGRDNDYKSASDNSNDKSNNTSNSNNNNSNNNNNESNAMTENVNGQTTPVVETETVSTATTESLGSFWDSVQAEVSSGDDVSSDISGGDSVVDGGFDGGVDGGMCGP